MTRKELAQRMGELDREAEPYETALREIEGERDAAVTKFGREGEEVVAWCELCGAPFFDDEDFVRGDDVSHCDRYTLKGELRKDFVCFEKEMPPLRYLGVDLASGPDRTVEPRGIGHNGGPPLDDRTVVPFPGAPHRVLP